MRKRLEKLTGILAAEGQFLAISKEFNENGDAIFSLAPASVDEDGIITYGGWEVRDKKIDDGAVKAALKLETGEE